MGSRKRGPLAALSDNSERFLCSEAPSLRFLTVVASLLSFSSASPSAGRQRCAFWMPCSRAPRFRASRSGPGIALSGIAFWSAALLGVALPSVVLLGVSLSDDIALSGVSLSIGCLAPDRHRVLDRASLSRAALRPGSLALALERRRAFERRRARACCASSAAKLIGGLPTARWLGCLTGLRRLGGQAAKRPQQSSTLLSRIGLGLLNNQRRRGRGIH